MKANHIRKLTVQQHGGHQCLGFGVFKTKKDADDKLRPLSIGVYKNKSIEIIDRPTVFWW